MLDVGLHFPRDRRTLGVTSVILPRVYVVHYLHLFLGQGSAALEVVEEIVVILVAL